MGFFNKLFGKKKTYSQPPNTNRQQIPASDIDRMQRIEASVDYRTGIYKKYYSNYPEMPYISQDRELNTDWLERAATSPAKNVIPKARMTRYAEDGLLPGHVYMLYWLSNVRRKRIPVYFEYKYGIDFVREKQFLLENGFIDEGDNLTQKGLDAIERHIEVIEEHSGPQNNQNTKPLDASKVENQSGVKAEVEKLVQIGMTQGKSSVELARWLRQKFDISKAAADQLMHTEMKRARTEAAKQSYQRNGNTHYQFLALGKDPCPVCQSLNGKVFLVKDMTPGKNAPPMHPGCECATAPYWDEDRYQRWLDSGAAAAGTPFEKYK